MIDSQSRLLLPIGIENQFFVRLRDPSQPRTDRGSMLAVGGFAFEMDLGALRFVAEEFLCRGALEIQLDTFSAFRDYLDQLPAAFQNRVIILDRSRTEFRKACAILKPVAADLGVELDEEMGTYIHSFIGPHQAAVLNEKDPRRSRINAHLLGLQAALFHLLVGMKYESQIDISLRNAVVSAECLRRTCRAPEATINLALITGLLNSYDHSEVGGLTRINHQ